MSHLLDNPPKNKRKFRKQVLHLYYLVWKVWHYRKDVISEKDALELKEQAKALGDAIESHKKGDENTDTLLNESKKADKIARRCGGRMYPVTFLSEHIEIILVAAILAIGIRTYFIQPFKIPTNSMYPTYAGMLGQPIANPQEAPEGLEYIWHKLRYFSSIYKITAPVDGQLYIPLQTEINRETGTLRSQMVRENIKGRNAFFLPTTLSRYTLFVGQEAVHIDVPAEFRLEEVLRKHIDPGAESFDAMIRKRRPMPFAQNLSIVPTGIHGKKGEAIFAFELQTGDMLFVDRFSYHFTPPEIGDPFVFRTGEIFDNEKAKYYIKRLVGKGGDKLHIQSGKLHRNGDILDDVQALEDNNARKGEYNGYFHISHSKHNTVTYSRDGIPGPKDRIPEKHYYAMGDNSINSRDSRFWGYVPETAVVGKPLFIFYPFSSRWGVAK